MFDNCGKWFSHNFFKTVPFMCCRCNQLLSFLYLRTSKTLSLEVFDECKTLLGQSKTLLRQSSVPCFVATNSGFVVTKFCFCLCRDKIWACRDKGRQSFVAAFVATKSAQRLVFFSNLSMT